MHFDTGSTMKSHLSPNKNIFQSGLTLIELMIAMTISSVLMVGISNIYSSSKQAYKINDEYSILQENSRLAFRFLTQDIRMAGYIGCAWSTGTNVDSTLDTDDLTADQEAFVNGFGTGLEGYEANGTGANTTLDLSAPTAGFNRTVNALFTGYIDGSDIIVVRHAGGGGVKLSGNKSSANFKIQDGGTNAIVDNCHAPSGICEGDILMVSDCSKGRMFQVTSLAAIGSGEIRVNHAATGSPGNDPLNTSWGGSSIDPATWFAPGDTEILKLNAYAYFIATGVSGQPTLMRKTNLTTPQELVEGVENMQILYGIDSNGDGRANQYSGAPVAVANNIVSARISLLMSTPGEIPKRNDDTKTYNMISENDTVNVRVTPIADRRIRKVFTTTVKLRNKGLIDE